VDMDTSGEGESNSTSDLVGLDAKIPGGMFDSTISDSLKKECSERHEPAIVSSLTNSAS
jgi:hypothetical protein